MKHLFVLFAGIAFFAVSSAGATYVVSTAGDDANSGSLAQPFRTLQHAISQAQPGDHIEVLPGVYQEATVVSQSGTAQDPIVITGTERVRDRPAAIFTSFKSITPGVDGFGSWQLHAGNIWKIQLPSSGWSLPIGQNMLLQNGEPMLPARWPTATAPVDFDRRGMAEASDGNVDLDSKGPQLPYNHVDYYTGTYIDSDLQGFDPNVWSGAHIDYCAGLNWWHRTGYVTGNNGDTLTFRFRYADNWPVHYDEPAEGDRYALWGHLSALTDPGEFFLDVNEVSGPTNVLYVWLPDGSSPVGQDIALRTFGVALQLDGSSHLEFRNLSFEGGSVQLNTLTDSIVLDGLDIRMGAINRNGLIYAGRRAISLQGSNHRVENSYIRYTDGFGIWSDATGIGIVNNVIGTNTAQSIDVDAVTDGLIEGNTLFEGGNSLIAIGAKNSLITRNHVYFAGMRITDLAVMNTWNAGDMMGTVISYNWAHSNLAPRVHARSWYGGQGIRFDAGAAPLGVSNATIHHNVVWNTTSDSDVTAWGLVSGQLNFQDSKIGIYHNTMEKNLVIGGLTAGASSLGHDVRRNISRSFNGNSVEAGT